MPSGWKEVRLGIWPSSQGQTDNSSNGAPFLLLELTLPGAASKMGCGLGLVAVNRLGLTVQQWEPRASWVMSWAWGTGRRVLYSGHGTHASTWRIPASLRMHSQLTLPAHHQHSCPADGQTEAQRGEAAPGGGEPCQKLQSFCVEGREPVGPEPPSTSICYIASLGHFHGPASPHSSWTHNYQVCFECGQP